MRAETRLFDTLSRRSDPRSPDERYSRSDHGHGTRQQGAESEVRIPIADDDPVPARRYDPPGSTPPEARQFTSYLETVKLFLV
jgi:hypothetical protein